MKDPIRNKSNISTNHRFICVIPLAFHFLFFLSSLTHLPPISLLLCLLTFGGEQMEIVARSVKPEAAKEIEFCNTRGSVKATTNGQLPPVSPDMYPGAGQVTQSAQSHLSCSFFLFGLAAYIMRPFLSPDSSQFHSLTPPHALPPN